MRALLTLGTLAAAGCTALTLQPNAVERMEPRGGRDTFLTTYVADFDVSCDSCRITYGETTRLLTDDAAGGWRHSVQLGALLNGQTLRVTLRVVPLGDGSVHAASIAVNGDIVDRRGPQEPGESVYITATVGPP